MVQPIISDSVSPSSFDKDDVVSRTEEGFYLLTAAVVDNTICRGLAQFDTKYQIYLYLYDDICGFGLYFRRLTMGKTHIPSSLGQIWLSHSI